MDPMREVLKELSGQILERKKDLTRIDKNTRLSFLSTIGRKRKIERADEQILEAVKEAGGLFAVDASYQRFGSASPHYLELYQGLGLSSTDQTRPVMKTAAVSPLTQADAGPDFRFGEQRSQEAEARLAAIELETAKELVQENRGYALIMDGSLIRFQILCPKPWEELRTLCARLGLPIAGVIEDIKTDSIGRALQAAGHTRLLHYDREILSGLLENGEIFVPKKEVSGKAERGLSTLFARFSGEPHVIGIDLDGDDEDSLVQLAAILYAITPSHGRGVPYLLDVVDEKARLAKRRTLETMKRSLDADVLETYFISGRDRRKL